LSVKPTNGRAEHGDHALNLFHNKPSKESLGKSTVNRSAAPLLVEVDPKLQRPDVEGTMEFFKAAFIGAVISIAIAVVIGSQGTSGGPLAVQTVYAADVRMYWSWPLFFSSSGLFWALMLLQR